MKRLAEFILGLIGGGIFTLVGFIGFILALYGNAPSFIVLTNIESMATSTGVSAALIVFLLALLGLGGAFLVRKKDTAAGVMMIVSGILGFAVSGFPWSFIWSFPLIIAGIMACLPKTADSAGVKQVLQ